MRAVRFRAAFFVSEMGGISFILVVKNEGPNWKNTPQP